VSCNRLVVQDTFHAEHPAANRSYPSEQLKRRITLERPETKSSLVSLDMGAAELLPGEGTLDPVVGRLEDFFGSPEFTSSVGAFLSAHAPAVVLPPAEQPLSNHSIFMQYTELIEAQLEAFIAREDLTQEQVFHACKRVKEGGDMAWLSCVDYLLAATEYERFLQIASDFQSMQQWEPAEGEAFLLEDYEM